MCCKITCNSVICSRKSTHPFNSAQNVDLTAHPGRPSIKYIKLALPLLLIGLDGQSSSINAAANPRNAKPVGSSNCALDATSVRPINPNGWRKVTDCNPHLCHVIHLITKLNRLQSFILGVCARRCKACTYTARSARVSTTQATAPSTDRCAPKSASPHASSPPPTNKDASIGDILSTYAC